MNQSEKDFIVLLQSGLWNITPEERLSETPVDWKEIISLADRHHVTDFILDAVNLLLSNVLPPAEDLYHLHYLASHPNKEHKHVGIRQICEWVLFLHTNRDKINIETLKHDLKRLNLGREWKIFGCLAVNGLNLPQSEFPFYDTRYTNKAKRIMEAIINKDNTNILPEIAYHRPLCGENGNILSFSNATRHTKWFSELTDKDKDTWTNNIYNYILQRAINTSTDIIDKVI